MDLSTGLLVHISIVNQDYSCTEALDYENVSFRCIACYGVRHLAKSCPKITQTLRHLKPTCWTGARPKHYTISNDVSGIQHDGTKEHLEENLPKGNSLNREPQVKETPMGAFEAILKTTATTPEKSNPFPKASYSTASPEFSDWKLATKKFSRAATVLQGTDGHKGTQKLKFGTLELPSVNKNIQYTLEKIGKLIKMGSIGTTTNKEKVER